MAQGREWTTEQRETIIQSIRPYLEQGFSRNKACEFVGLPPQTLSNWAVSDESLGIKLTSWENALNKLAINNIADALMKESESDDSKKETSRWWLERKLKTDFSTKTETDVTSNGESVAPVLIKFIDADNRDTSGV